MEHLLLNNNNFYNIIYFYPMIQINNIPNYDIKQIYYDKPNNKFNNIINKKIKQRKNSNTYKRENWKMS
jgi:hypothetical protein